MIHIGFHVQQQHYQVLVSCSNCQYRIHTSHAPILLRFREMRSLLNISRDNQRSLFSQSRCPRPLEFHLTNAVDLRTVVTSIRTYPSSTLPESTDLLVPAAVGTSLIRCDAPVCDQFRMPCLRCLYISTLRRW